MKAAGLQALFDEVPAPGLCFDMRNNALFRGTNIPLPVQSLNSIVTSLTGDVVTRVPSPGRFKPFTAPAGCTLRPQAHGPPVEPEVQHVWRKPHQLEKMDPSMGNIPK